MWIELPAEVARGSWDMDFLLDDGCCSVSASRVVGLSAADWYLPFKKKIYSLMRKFGFLGIVGNRLANVNGR